MKAENMNILEHTLQGSLNLESFYFYKTDFPKPKLCCSRVLRTPQRHSRSQFVSSHEDPKVGFSHFSVEVQMSFV